MVVDMESDFDAGRGPEPSARDSLAAIAVDRRRLGRLASAPPWYYPAVGLGTAVVVASPAFGSPVAMAIACALAATGLAVLPSLFARRTGLSISRPAGAGGVVFLVALALIVLLLLMASVVLVVLDSRPWVALTAAAGFLVQYPGGLLYDRIYRAELSRA